MTYKIVQKHNPLAVYAAGFYTIERAQDWLARYNPMHWMEKHIQANDLCIIEER